MQMMWPRWLLTGSMKYTKWWPTYATSGRHSPELVDDVSWQEVDVIVSQRHTSILHPLPENNISQRNLLCKFWFLTCGAGWVFPRPTKKVSENRSVFSEAFQKRQNMILVVLRCPVYLRHGWLMEVHLHFLHQVVETWGSKTYCVLKRICSENFSFSNLWCNLWDPIVVVVFFTTYAFENSHCSCCLTVRTKSHMIWIDQV